MRRTRGFTLMEILIAMALTAIVTASVLAIVRTQLMAFEQSDQIVRAQQNTRAGMDFVENTVRRACGGVNQGAVGVNIAGVTPKIVPCVKVYDGATVSAGSIATGTLSSPDALEIIYGTGTMTALKVGADLTSSSTITVMSTTGFSQGDYVLIGDMNNANLYKIASAPTATTITFDAQATLPTTPANLRTVATTKSPISALLAGTYVLKAATYTFFVSPQVTNGSGGVTLYSNMLMVDPNGVASTNHLDYGNTVQPAVEGVDDFQVAIGQDSDGNGIVNDTNPASTDEWLGNVSGEIATIADPNTTPWNQAVLTVMPQLRQIRMGLIVHTMNKYPGTAPTLPTFEDRTSLPASSTANPRYRTIRMVVAPRAWNLSE